MEPILNLAWLLPVPPFLAFAAIILFLNRYKTISVFTAIGGAVLSLLLGWPIAFAAFTTEGFSLSPVQGELYQIPTGATNLWIGYQVDPANALMIFMSTFLVLMIFIYSKGYMTFPKHLLNRVTDYQAAYDDHKDPRYSRFMAYISLFAVGMFGLVISNSLVMFFIFWEVMGLCSYLLIGFWYEKPSAYKAALKAFITTGVGDVIMFSGMMLLYVYSRPSTLMFSEILSPENLHHLAETMITLPVLNLTVPVVGLIAVLIFFGTIGKSSQFPLHVWLPDAMEGPTPVSAMIHAATMVSAGVFLLVRMFPLYAVAGEVSPSALQFVAFIGAFTALFASTIAVAQWDIKRVLAYSTISQLGFMVAAIGVGAYVAALFHLIIHAFFKALLFLGSGSVIHGVEHGQHDAHEPAGEHGHGHASHPIERIDGVLDPNDAQDMRNMGGLLKRMPITGWTFIIGGLALSGFPLVTAGFWSKDEILASAWTGGNTFVLLTLALAAFLTAFYTARQIGLTFLGKARTEAAEHASESTLSMTLPLILITPFAIALGWMGIHKDFPILGGIAPSWIEQFMEPYIEHLEIHVTHPEFSYVPLLISLVVALGGLAAGWYVYGRGYAAEQIDPLRKALGPLWVLLHRKYYVDEFYQHTIIPFVRGCSKFLSWFDDVWVIDPIVDGIGKFGVWLSGVVNAIDQYVVDGFVNGTGWVANQLGRLLRNTQDGRVQTYLLFAAVAVVIWLLLIAMPILLTLV